MDSLSEIKDGQDLFAKMRDGVLSIDPCGFCERYLTLDGDQFSLHGNGYKPLADVYRYIGIKALESDSKPVVITKGRQIGATTMAGALELFFMCSGLFGTNNRAPMRVMHCFPLLDLGYIYTKTKLNTMIKMAVPSDSSQIKTAKPKSYIEARLDRSASSNDSLQYKQFEYGNHILVDSVGLTGDRIRGRTVDAMFFDEVQDIPGVALSNAVKCLSQAKYGAVGEGIQVYFGTPKAKGSDFHKIWLSSTQQYYYLGCEKCGEHFPLYTPESSDWEEIWIEDDLPPDHPSHGFIVKCIHCGHEQDKRPAAERGKWVAVNADKDADFVGYHLNQLYMPHFPRSKIISEKPENHPTNTERLYQTEVLGEFFTGDASPITADEIHELCADMGRKFRKTILLEESKRVYLGLDWGQKIDAGQMVIGDREKRQQGQSYSSAVVLTLEGPDLLSVDFALLLKKNDPEYKKAIVDQLLRQYSVTQAIGDIGYANDLTANLQREYGDRFLASRAGGKIKHHVKFSDDVYPKEIIFERDFYIEELFSMMKKGQIRFPYGSYEQIGWLVQHCSSMEVKPTMDRGGNINIRYVKGSTPNDGFMALLNAYLAYKFDISGGFKIIHPDDQDNDPSAPTGIPAVGGYLPFMNPLNRNR